MTSEDRQPARRLTLESKRALRELVRGAREWLPKAIRDHAEERYLLAVKKSPKLSAARLEERRRLLEALTQRAEEEEDKNPLGRALDEAAKAAAATLLNRLVLVLHLEALGLSKPLVLTGKWLTSTGYRQFRDFVPALCSDETQGMGPLLELLFDDLSLGLPGLFGDVGLSRLLPVRGDTLRKLIEKLQEIDEGAWHDDHTLGWVYQFWNDPDREALDAKLNERGKLEPHELASKTQMFTERYMVDWLLQNSLGPTWLAMCRKNGWTAEVEATGTLDRLEALREQWRKDLTQPMEVQGELEEAWKYYVKQPLPQAVVDAAPASVKDLKVLDPACGSGHFLVVAFDLLKLLYREEARHRGESWTDEQIAEWIVERNLHGVDIDPRAIQIAAAGLYLKARALAPNALPKRMNLVAPALRLSALDAQDPALVKLEADIKAETGIPAELTRRIIEVLAGVEHLGTLLKVGDAIDKAIDAHQGVFSKTGRQEELFGEGVPTMPLDRGAARLKVDQLLLQFLANHAGGEDLGVRLRGEQLSAAVRFATLARDCTYDLVVGNPPYQGTLRIKDAGYVKDHYPLGGSNLYAAFLERGLELCRPGGGIAMVTLASWMFDQQFQALRYALINQHDIRALCDLRWSAFEQMRHDTVAMLVCRRDYSNAVASVATCPSPRSERDESIAATGRKRAAVLAQVGLTKFEARGLQVIEGSPLVYWWTHDRLAEYDRLPKLGSVAPVRYGLSTQNNVRWLRRPWEVPRERMMIADFREERGWNGADWVPYIKGANGQKWCDAVSDVLLWRRKGLELAVYPDNRYGRGTNWYFTQGVAFVNIGASFSARVHRLQSIFGHVAASVFGMKPADALCLLNSARAVDVMESLNPGLHFLTTDVQRLPIFQVSGATEIFDRLQAAFSQHEAARESSVEFVCPGPSAWRYTQEWAQCAVDRQPGAPLPEFKPEFDEPTPDAIAQFKLGEALGLHKRGNGSGILFVTPTGVRGDGAAQLERDFTGHSSKLVDWLCDEWFALHKKTYESRPIVFPLSSPRRTFLLLVNIHKWTDSTLATLLTSYLLPYKAELDGILADLHARKLSTEKKERSALDDQFAQTTKWMTELDALIAAVRAVADTGPKELEPDEREVDAPFAMNLDDGVMINSAGLWSLLEPFWKEPKKWWRELAHPKGKKDYDWSHLAQRYFPKRVAAKCEKDPSLAVAHGCFWRLHPEKAYQWELRLQDEIRPGFTIDEPDSDEHRKRFLAKNAERAAELRAAEEQRRKRKADKQDQRELELADEEQAEEEASDSE